MSYLIALLSNAIGSDGPFGRFVRIVLQIAALAAIWFVADLVARKFALPVPGGVVGLLALLALLFCGGVAPRWVKAGADWLLADMLLFFIPAAVAAMKFRTSRSMGERVRSFPKSFRSRSRPGMRA